MQVVGAVARRRARASAARVAGRRFVVEQRRLDAVRVRGERVSGGRRVGGGAGRRAARRRQVELEANERRQAAQNDAPHHVRHLGTTQSAMMQVERDHRQSRGERHQTDGHAVIQTL